MTTATYTLKKYREDWKTLYNSLYHEHYKKDYPAAYNSGNVPVVKFPDVRKTNGLTRFVIDTLNWSGGYANRISSAGRYLPAANRFIPGPTNKGTADIHAIIDGKHWSIEIKSASTKDKIREHQTEEQKRVMAAGGNYMIVKDADSFTTLIQTMLRTN